ncbi:hypothetical protein FRC12_017904 [Ceratobasidium sp. 428]|nr:hypothetical protein FRC12_017904 [Ceratobasidium sp. 428]
MPTTSSQKMQHCKQSTNRTYPINELPNEILAEIFVVCPRICVYANYVSYTWKKPYGDYACQAAVARIERRQYAANGDQ